MFNEYGMSYKEWLMFKRNDSKPPFNSNKHRMNKIKAKRKGKRRK